MDKALKQRLVGATVLIALAVIVLPMMLSGPQEGATPQSQKIELPPRPDEVSFETRRYPLGERGEVRTEAPGRADLPVPGPASRTRDDGEPLAEPPAGEPADEPISAVAETAEPVPAERDMPLPRVDVEPAPSVEVQPVAAPPDPAPSSRASDGRYVVQVASLGSDANARKLMENLQKAGFDVLLDTVQTDAGRLSRVRTGPYDDEAAANDALRRIREQVEGVNPRLVDTRPGDSSRVSSPADPLVRWVVQVGSFGEAANADGLVERLRGGGLPAYSETVASSGTSIHRVRVGPFLEREEALGARQRLIAEHALEGVVMSTD